MLPFLVLGLGLDIIDGIGGLKLEGNCLSSLGGSLRKSASLIATSLVAKYEGRSGVREQSSIVGGSVVAGLETRWRVDFWML